MKTGRLHGDVIAGMPAYRELDHQLVPAGTEAPGCWPALEQASWRPGDDHELTGDQADRLLSFARRPDAGVQREVLRALLPDGLVRLTVDARVADGIVTLTGTVGCEPEREDARQAAGWVPGVAGIIDDLACLPRQRAGVAVREDVAAALARTAIAGAAGLAVDQPCPGTVVLSGAVRTRRDHDLATATAWSVAGVTAVDDCIDVGC